ncbi:MAG: hypothetical protein V1850_07405 [Candidatus Bathyarchaeota archaeon]
MCSAHKGKQLKLRKAMESEGKLGELLKSRASFLLVEMKNVDLEIAEKLHERQPYNVIAKELRVSAKTISKVSGLIDSGAIRIDKDGKAYFVDGIEPKPIDKMDEYAPLVYGIMRALGAENPKVGLEQAYKFIAKINPYVLNYNVKTPAELVSHLEAQINALKNELNTYTDEDVLSLAKRIGITDETIRSYQWWIRNYGDRWNGTLVDFLNESVEGFMRGVRGRDESSERRIVKEYTL